MNSYSGFEPVCIVTGHTPRCPANLGADFIVYGHTLLFVGKLYYLEQRAKCCIKTHACFRDRPRQRDDGLGRGRGRCADLSRG